MCFFLSLTYKKLGSVENLKWRSKIPVFLFISWEINARTLEQLCCYDSVNLAFGVLILPKKSDCLPVHRTVRELHYLLWICPFIVAFTADIEIQWCATIFSSLLSHRLGQWIFSVFSRLLGPRCLLSCLIEGLPIPDSNSPIYTTAMRGLVVTTTNFSGKEKVSEWVTEKEFHCSVFIFQGNFITTLIKLIYHHVLHVLPHTGSSLGASCVYKETI